MSSIFNKLDRIESAELLNKIQYDNNVKLAIEEIKKSGNFLEDNVNQISKNYKIDLCETMHLINNKQVFKIAGFYKDYYIKIGGELKFIASETNVAQDREILGYYGRKEEIASCDFIVNKKKIKKDTVFITELRTLQTQKLKQLNYIK